MTDTATLWNELLVQTRTIARIEEIRAVLTWDQQTQLPRGAAAGRAEQVAFLVRLQHGHLTDPRFGEVLAALAARTDLEERRRAGVRNHLRTHVRAARVPAALMERIGRLQGEGFTAWMRAREANDHRVLVPVLAEIVDAARERAAAIDPDRDAYDVMLDEFDPGSTARALAPMFARLRVGLVELLDAIRGVAPLPALAGRFDPEGQLAFSRWLAPVLGYDTERGRLDLSEHPFTIHLGPGDVRITSRFAAADLLGGLGSTLHEAGHALYEQGLPSEYGSGIDAAASMSVHESQSRFWENTIGRSRAFCGWIAPLLRERFGADAPDAETLYRAANRVAPGVVRVAADEVTYNLHVIVRFELEQALFSGALRVADLRDAWNAAYERALGLLPPDDLRGVLQDVHWPTFALGYFPTYTLGNLYAASFARVLEAHVPDLWDHVARGEFAPVLRWLRDRIHRHGHTWDAPELVRRVVGERDGVADLLDHLWSRHGTVHGVARPTSSPS